MSSEEAAPRPLVLRQILEMAGSGTLAWEPLFAGVAVHWIYRVGADGPAAALIRFQPGGRVPLHEHPGHEHIFVLQGSQTDEHGTLVEGDVMIHAPGTRHRVVSADGCLVLAIYERRVRFLDDDPLHLA